MSNVNIYEWNFFVILYHEFNFTEFDIPESMKADIRIFL